MNTSIQTRVPRCTGPCQQGRRECPAPDACENPEPLTSADYAWVYGIAAGVLLAIGAVSAALWPY